MLSSPDDREPQTGLFEADAAPEADQGDDELIPELPSKGRAGRQRAVTPALTASFVRKPDRMLVALSASKAMTVTARKLNTVMIAVAQRQGLDKQQFIAPLHALADLIGFSSRNHQLLKDTIREMQSNVIQWGSPVGSRSDEDGIVWSSAAVLSGVDLLRLGGMIYVRWEYASNYRRDILEPMPYAVVLIESIQKLRSVAGFALYEICARYKNTHNGLTSKHHWRWWKEALKAEPGKADPDAGEFKAFNRDVLKRAIAEVNSATELELELVVFKLGRGVSDLQFKVRVKREAAQEVFDAKLIEPVDAQLLERVAKVDIQARTMQRLVTTYGADRVNEGVSMLLRRIADPSADTVHHPASWLEGAIKRKQGSEPAPKQHDLVKRPADSELTHVQLREARLQEAWRLYASLDEESRMLKRNAFEAEVLFGLSPRHKESWQKHREQGTLVRSLFRTYLAEQLFGEDWASLEEGGGAGIAAGR